MSSFALVTFLLLMAMEVSQACLPMNDVFKYSTIWMQPISVPDRHLLTIGQDKEEKIIKIRTERDAVVATHTCLESHGQHRYMMKVELPNGRSYFQCVKYISLTPQVVRIASSAQNPSKEKLNCEQTVYMEEKAVLIAYLDIPTQPCALQGGFQMRIQENDADVCKQEGWNENPSINFECGPSKNVIAQFGKHCVPQVLKDAQKMRRRYLTHLNCVSSWEEPGKGKFILLNMRDMYTTFWCLNYGVETDEVLSVYLTFDGRCAKKPAEADAASRIGHLIRYIPPSDSRCSDPSGECYALKDECSKSNRCRHRCNRCIAERKKKAMCRFRLSTAGQWKTVTSRYSLQVDVDTSNFTTSDQGEFECTDFEERLLHGKVYPVVQYGSSPSCLPFHACSQMLSPYPGLLNFCVKPAATEYGQIVSCARTYELFGHIVPVSQEETYTLLDESKLENVSCNFGRRQTFDTKQDDKCKLAIENCSGLCDTLEVGYDIDTCGNDTRYMMKLETTHTCQARIPFREGHHGILTKSVPYGRFLCWIFTKDKELIVTHPHNCNSDQVFFIVAFYKDDYEYDPIFQLSKNNAVGGGSVVESGSYSSWLFPSLKGVLLQVTITFLYISSTI